MIAVAFVDYYLKTSILFRAYNPQTDRDYVYITGKVDGCWSYVGRIGGVSNMAQGVVKSPAQRTAQQGVRSRSPKTNPGLLTHHHPELTSNPRTVLSELQ
jgi:hypothetical protein